MKYRKRPVVIDAWSIYLLLKARILGEKLPPEVQAGIDAGALQFDGDGIKIYTLEGTMRGNAGAMLIKGVAGEFYACERQIFAATYERPCDVWRRRTSVTSATNRSPCGCCRARPANRGIADQRDEITRLTALANHGNAEALRFSNRIAELEEEAAGWERLSQKYYKEIDKLGSERECLIALLKDLEVGDDLLEWLARRDALLSGYADDASTDGLHGCQG